MVYTAMMALILLLFAFPQQAPKPSWVAAEGPLKGYWSCPDGWTFVALPKGECRKTVISEDSPRAHAISIFPHPLEPQHLQRIPMDIEFRQEHKFWFIQWTEALNSAKVRVEQKRPKDGWYICGYQYLDATGKLISPMQIDPTWRDPTVILVALLDGNGREVAHTEIQADSKKLLAGETLTGKGVFQ